MKRILLADDEQSSSEIIKYFIRKNQLPLEVVAETASGDETVSAILKYRPDIAFLDIEMPVLNGLQVMEQINRIYKGNISFIIITAFDSFSYIQQALRLNARDFLLKPVLYEQFCETMQRVVGYRYFDNPLFNQVLEYIDQHYSESLQLNICAKDLCISESNLSRMFKKYLQTNFTSYCNELRIHRAIEYLKEGRPIKEAAEAVGYHNLNYFYKNFKQHYGMTPREYLENQPDKETDGFVK